MTAAVLRVRAGALDPVLAVPLSDFGKPVDLSHAERVSVVGVRDDDVIAFEDDRPAVDVVNGVVTHRWKPDETKEPGRIWVTVKVFWPGPGVQTFPEFESIAVDVY